MVENVKMKHGEESGEVLESPACYSEEEFNKVVEEKDALQREYERLSRAFNKLWSEYQQITLNRLFADDAEKKN